MNVLKKAPFLIILEFLIAGILSGYYLNPNLFYTEIILIMFVLLAAIGTITSISTGGSFINMLHSLILLLSVALFACFITVKKINSISTSVEYETTNNKYTQVYGTILSVKPGSKTSMLEMFVQKVKNDENKIITRQFKLLVFIKNSLNKLLIKEGQTYWMQGRLSTISPSIIPGEINWAGYYRNRSISQQLSVDGRGQVLYVLEDDDGLTGWAHGFREKLKNALSDLSMDTKTEAILTAMLLGEKAQMTKELKFVFSNSGVMHVLAVSGLHVGIIYIIIKSIFTFFFRSRKGFFTHFIPIASGIWIYALITGLSPSVTRSAFMFSILLLSESLKVRSNSYNSIFCSAFFILCSNPLMLFDVGFQLSYTAVLGIVSIYPLLKSAFWMNNYLLDKLMSLFSVSIAAQLATLPVVLYYFQQFPTYFLLSNLIAIPAVSVLIPMAIVLILSIHIPSLAILTETGAGVLDFMTGALHHMLSIISHLPGASVNIMIKDHEVVILFLCLLLFLSSFYFGNKIHFKLAVLLIMLFPVLSCVMGIIRYKQKFEYLICVQNDLYMGAYHDGKHSIVPLWVGDGSKSEDKLIKFWDHKNLPYPEWNDRGLYNKENVFFDLTVNKKRWCVISINDTLRKIKIPESTDYNVVLLKGNWPDSLVRRIKRNNELKIFSFQLEKKSHQRHDSLQGKINSELRIIKYNDYVEFN